MNWGKTYITLAGVIGVMTGLLGFVDNAFVGDPANDAIFATDAVHNVIHVGTGVLGLYIGLAMSGATQARGIIGFGILYLVLAVMLMASPSMFGLMQVDVNTADDVLHVALGLVTSAVGFAAYAAGDPGSFSPGRRGRGGRALLNGVLSSDERGRQATGWSSPPPLVPRIPIPACGASATDSSGRSATAPGSRTQRNPSG